MKKLSILATSTLTGDLLFSGAGSANTTLIMYKSTKIQSQYQQTTMMLVQMFQMFINHSCLDRMVTLQILSIVVKLHQIQIKQMNKQYKAKTIHQLNNQIIQTLVQVHKRNFQLNQNQEKIATFITTLAAMLLDLGSILTFKLVSKEK